MRSPFSRYKAIDRQHKAEAEEHAVGRKPAAAADVGLRHHVVNYDIQHRSGCKGERKRQYAARERYGKVAEKNTPATSTAPLINATIAARFLPVPAFRSGGMIIMASGMF